MKKLNLYDKRRKEWWTYEEPEPGEFNPMSCKRELWYRQEAGIWEEALPLGNGTLGAMVYSGAVSDRIQINQETLWTGAPRTEIPHRKKEDLEPIRELIRKKDYIGAEAATTDILTGSQCEAYSCYGSLYVDITADGHKSGSDCLTLVEDYTRRLNLETAVVTTEYTLGGDRIRKDCFVSMEDNVLVMRIRSEKGSFFHVYQAVELEHSCRTQNGIITVQGRCPTGYRQGPVYEDGQESIRFCSMLQVSCDQPMQIGGAGAWVYQYAHELTILFALDTSFNGFDKMPVSQGKDCKAGCTAILKNAQQYSFDQLLQRHIQKFRTYFDRVSLQIQGESYDHLPTNERIRNMGSGTVDNHLVTLLFDFGRYLTITGTATGSQPLNLVGIWNDRAVGAWRGDMHLNINAQMNYWPTETVNLPECHMGFLNMIKELSTKGNFYDLPGWAAWLSTDIWRSNLDHSTTPVCAMWPFGGAWSCRHIWEHYLHTRDLAFLEEYYPVLEGAARFLEGWMVEDENGMLTTSPSVSPEHYFLIDGYGCSVVAGSAMDLSIIFDLFEKLTLAAKELGKDASHYARLLTRIRPVQITADGRILELDDVYQEWQPGHRHMSHLYGLFPADTLRTPELLEAAKTSLHYRLEHGSAQHGWSNAWVACLFARLKDGEQVMYYIRNMFRKSMYANMFDAHPPFQIDGNFGICAAICEALMQSHTGTVELIPALPKEWRRGEVRGFITRTGEIVNFRWENGVAERF